MAERRTASDEHYEAAALFFIHGFWLQQSYGTISKSSRPIGILEVCKH